MRYFKSLIANPQSKRPKIKPAVLVYADTLLPRSNNFILHQSEALVEFVPYFAGPRSLGSRGLEMPTDRMLVINRLPGLLGKVRELPFRRVGFAPFFLRRLEKCGAVLVHAHSGPAGLAALRISKRLRVPQLTTFHGFDATVTNLCGVDPRFGNRNYMHRKKELMHDGNQFIAISKFIKDRLVAQGFPENKVLVHYIGVNTDFFRPDETATRDSIVLFVGALIEVKGCEYLIRAMARVQSLHPETELVVIGEGPLRDKLERIAEKQLKRYRFLGFQSPEAVRHWMNRASVFSGPSVQAESGATEGFGLVFAEAQAMCLPVTSFLSGGISEAVAHNETGLLANEGDWEALARNIVLLLENKSMWQRMSKAGRQRVCSRFDLKIQTGVLEEIYREVIAAADLRCHL